MKLLERHEEHNATLLMLQINPAEYLTALDAAYWNQRERYPVPGYPAGEAPRPVLEQLYGPDVLCNEALTVCISTYYNALLRQAGLVQLSQPELLDVQWPEEGGVVLRLRSLFYPEVTLGAYQGLVLPADLSEEQAERAALDQAAANMTVSIPTPLLERKLDALEAQKKAELLTDPVCLLLTDLYQILDSACRLVGVTRGRLQLRSAAAEIVMQTLSGDHAEPTLSEIRDAVTAMVARYRDLPDDFDHEVEQLIAGKLKLGREMEPAQRGEQLFETFLSCQDLSHTAWRSQQTRAALAQVRQDLLLDAVAETQALEAGEAEIDALLLTLAAHSGASADEVRRSVDRDTLAWQVRRNKARRLIVQSAVRGEAAP